MLCAGAARIGSFVIFLIDSKRAMNENGGSIGMLHLSYVIVSSICNVASLYYGIKVVKFLLQPKMRRQSHVSENEHLLQLHVV